MDGIFVALALVVLAVPVAVIVLAVLLFRLSSRNRRLEDQVAALRLRVDRLGAASQPAPAPDAKMPSSLAAQIPEAPAPVEALDDPSSAPMESPWGKAKAPEPTAPKKPPVPEKSSLPETAAVVTASAPTVGSPDYIGMLGDWLRGQWVYVVSGLSLALAGVFLVQYGAERGWLPPVLRVLLAIAFGAALIAAGDVLRRRFGDAPDRATAYLPSVFSAAGIVSVFSGILAARFLYGLIGPVPTFAGLVLTALAAVFLGWRLGPFLAAMGLTGATAAPFLTGGGSEAPDWLMAHFALVAAMGLAIDTLRRWAWVSVLALGLAFVAGWLMVQAGASVAAFGLLVAVLVPLAIAIPARGLVPDHQGPSVLQGWMGKDIKVPFPVSLAAGTVLAATLALVALDAADAATVTALLLLLAGLAVLLVLWPDRAPALHELALIPATGFVLRLLAEAADYGPLHAAYVDASIALRLPETAPPQTVAILLSLAGVMTLALALRVLRGTLFPVVLSVGASALPVAAAVLVELFWSPASVLGPFAWAVHVMALAALMTVLALSFARVEPADARRATAHAALSALGLIALACFILTGEAALTLALSVLVVCAAALDRRFVLPEMGLAVQAGLAVVFFRLVIDPGIGWAVETSLLAALLSYLGPALAAGAALVMLRDLPRPATRAALEAASLVAPALLADVLVLRLMPDAPDHALTVALGLPWILVCLGQLWRAQPGLAGRRLRLVLAGVSALPAAGALLTVLFLTNPLFNFDPVAGPPFLNTLALAYAVPGALFLFVRARIGWLPASLRMGLLVAGAGFLTVYAGLAIRHLWQGPDISQPGVTQAELYSYTIAALLLGAGLLWQAIARNSSTLRRAAMIVIGLTAAKVFLLDAAGLSGLIRVFSFLALGLSLAGLAWLNRWAAIRTGESGPKATPPL